MYQLRHKDNYSPEQVVQKALAVGTNVLFPSLERTFGIADSSLGRSGSAFGLGGNLFPAEFNNTTASGKDSRAKTTGGDAFASDDFLPSSDAAARASTPGGGAAPGHTTTGAHASTRKAHASTGRKGFEPLHIQSMTQDRLQAAVKESKVGLFYIANYKIPLYI